MTNSDIVYLCKGEGMTCFLHPYCTFRGDPIAEGDPVCSHTLNPECAKYGVCEDPENHPERFIFQELPEACRPSYYWEEEPK